MNRVLQKVEDDDGNGTRGTSLADTSLVGSASQTDQWGMLLTAAISGYTLPTAQTREETSSKENEARCFQAIRKSLESQQVAGGACELIMRSWQKSTKAQYNTYIQRWITFCEGHFSPINPPVNSILALFVYLYRHGLKYRYSVLQTARAVINNFITICGGPDFRNSETIISSNVS